MQEQTQEQAQQVRPEVEAAFKYLRDSNDYDVRNLVSAIKKAGAGGGDCFDVWGCAKVLAQYAQGLGEVGGVMALIEMAEKEKVATCARLAAAAVRGMLGASSTIANDSDLLATVTALCQKILGLQEANASLEAAYEGQ